MGTLFTSPMDAVKTRLMVTDQYDTLTHAVAAMYRHEGLQSFFAGTSSRLLHKVGDCID
jgi:hypothetical protein